MQTAPDASHANLSRASFTFPSGRVQTTNYDQAKRLTALFDNFNSVNVDLASNFGYYPNGGKGGFRRSRCPPGRIRSQRRLTTR